MAIKDGGPAYPCERKERVRFVADGVFDPEDPRNWAIADASYPGMSLRDYFAGQALAFLQSRENVMAIINHGETRGEENNASLARVAYEVADAMIKAREVSHVE